MSCRLWPGESRPDQARPDQARPGQARPDQTRLLTCSSLQNISGRNVLHCLWLMVTHGPRRKGGRGQVYPVTEDWGVPDWSALSEREGILCKRKWHFTQQKDIRQKREIIEESKHFQRKQHLNAAMMMMETGELEEWREAGPNPNVREGRIQSLEGQHPDSTFKSFVGGFSVILFYIIT